MLKIYINNEEVIANQNFTIQKHMLNTPSVILNNVCPKTWCDEKDYITNFYHPLDYSKCKIVDETFHPYDPGETIKGTSFTIQNYDSTKLVELTELDGNTTQETTTGKNLFDNTKLTPVVEANTKLSTIETGVRATLYGTLQYASARIVYKDLTNYVGKTIRLRANFIASSTNNGRYELGICDSQGNNTQIKATTTTSGEIISFVVPTLSDNIKYLYLRFYGNNNGTGVHLSYVDYTNVILTINNEDMTYEEYTGGQPSPSPDYPQPINVVSGRQDINVVGKNLFGTTLQQGGYAFATGNFFTSSNYVCSTDFINVISGETYILSFKGNSNNYGGMGFIFYNNGTYVNYSQLGNNVVTIPSGVNQIKFDIYNPNGITPSNIYEVQLEKGNQATTYEAYKGQSYEINLGKNLIDISTLQDGYVASNGVVVRTGLTNEEMYSNFIKVEPYTKYTFKIFESSWSGIENNNWLGIGEYSSNNISSFIRRDVLGGTNTSITITTSQNTQYIIVSARGLKSATKIQLEKGASATTWSAYKTPIELCKIGTYQDRIYKENGTWYLHKEIGKVVLTGSENWNNDGGTQGTDYRHNIYYASRMTIPTAIGSNNTYISNYFIASNVGTDVGELGKFYMSGTWLVFPDKNKVYDLAQWKTWLSTHNTIVYYVLATPTTTEITDSELISQLNAIELLEGLNNVSVSSADLPSSITIHYNYKEAYTTEDLLFCGVVKNSGKISLNPREPHYTTLQVLDFKDFLSSGETLDFVIYQKTILEAIQQVISTVQDYGFILGNVNILNPNEIIGAYSTKDKTAYDVFNYIADITQSRWTTRMIDENTVAIDFYDPTLMPQGTEIDYTNAYFNDKLIDDMKYSYGTNNYRNKQVMISKQVYSNISQAQTIVANGYQTQFPTEQPIGKINSITSNGIPLTFATFNEKDMGYVADFYYNPGNNYFESDELRSTGEVLIIDYVAIVEGRQVITNSTEIDRINESTGRKGIIARYETRNDATTSTELQKIGESYIKYKGTPEIVLTIQSRKNTWEVGQRVQFNAPIDELDTEYMVRSKKINYIANQQENESQLFYTYELISSFNSETEINYFDNQRAKASGNIGEGEYISRNIDIESTANIIFYDTETTEVQVSGDNELNSILNSPFIS